MRICIQGGRRMSLERNPDHYSSDEWPEDCEICWKRGIGNTGCEQCEEEEE
jgi:hypothetical protein